MYQYNSRYQLPLLRHDCSIFNELFLFNRRRFNVRVCDQLVVDRCNTQP